MEAVLREIVLSLRKRKHHVELILAATSEDTFWENDLNPEYLFEMYPKFSTIEEKIHVQQLKMSTILKDKPSEVVVCLSAASLAICRKATNDIGLNIIIVSWLHFSMHKEKYKQFLQYADKHLCISAEIAEQISLLAPSVPRDVIYNPVQINNNMIKRAESPVFLYVGRLDINQKRIDILLKALSILHGEWELMVIGDGADSASLQTHANELRVDSRVNWLGWSNNPWSLVTEATCLILPSDFEGFPSVLIEALSRGIPVISSDCMTGPKEIVVHEGNGWLFQPGDAEQLAFILQCIVNGNVSLPKADVCVDSIKKFDISIFINNFENNLLELFSSRSF
ncbi:hypothetical protein BK147_09540 [Paenibacillus sp. FSL R7-0337]|nr:hypothetical protein BK147_09540 [Paenibacillus sp. FSL R7-0337]